MEKLVTNLTTMMLGLKKVKEKKYSSEETKTNEVYIFHNEEDYQYYFIENGLEDIPDKELLNLAKLAELKNGDIIAFKGLCDHIIRNKTSQDTPNKNKFKILTKEKK